MQRKEPETSANDVADAPGDLKLRDVACVRQNDQLRTLYGLVHAVGMLRGDQSVTLRSAPQQPCLPAQPTTVDGQGRTVHVVGGARG